MTTSTSRSSPNPLSATATYSRLGYAPLRVHPGRGRHHRSRAAHSQNHHGVDLPLQSPPKAGLRRLGGHRPATRRPHRSRRSRTVLAQWRARIQRPQFQPAGNPRGIPSTRTCSRTTGRAASRSATRPTTPAPITRKAISRFGCMRRTADDPRRFPRPCATPSSRTSSPSSAAGAWSPTSASCFAS